MIDKWDVAKLEKWLKLAKTKGTDAIRIVSGGEPNTWMVIECNDKDKEGEL